MPWRVGEGGEGRPGVDRRKGKIGSAEHNVLDALGRLELGKEMVTLALLIHSSVALAGNPNDEPLFRRNGRAKRAILTLTKKGLIDHMDGIYFSVEK